MSVADKFGQPSSNPYAPETRKPTGADKPSAGQTKSYSSENARGQSQKRTNSDTTAGDAAASGPGPYSGWPSRSPSKRQ